MARGVGRGHQRSRFLAVLGEHGISAASAGWSPAGGRSTDGVPARAPALAMEIALPGTTYMRQPGDRPPWVRFVVQIACGQVGDDADWGRRQGGLGGLPAQAGRRGAAG